MLEIKAYTRQKLSEKCHGTSFKDSQSLDEKFTPRGPSSHGPEEESLQQQSPDKEC